MKRFIAITYFDNRFHYMLYSGSYFHNSTFDQEVNRDQAKGFMAGCKMSFVNQVRLSAVNTRVYRVQDKQLRKRTFTIRRIFHA